MLGILFTVLKIIGITLLAILCLFVFLILIVLFVPLRYKAEGFYRDKKYLLKANISFLLHILSVSINFDGKMDMAIKIFGIKIGRRKRKNKANSKKNDIDSDEPKVDVINQKENEENISDEATNTSVENTNVVAEGAEPANAKAEDVSENTEAAENIDADTLDNVNDSDSAVNDKTDKKNKAKNESFIKKIKYYWDLFHDESVKRAVSQCKRRIGLMIKSILPRKGRIYIRLGLENAGIVGELYGLYSALFIYIGNVVKFVPVYTEKAFEAELKLRGHIRAIALIHQLICVLLDKDCRKLIKILLKKDRRMQNEK